MTQNQFDEYKMYLSFDDKIKQIRGFIENIITQCDGNSRTTGYFTEGVMKLKSDLRIILDKHQNISNTLKDEI